MKGVKNFCQGSFEELIYFTPQKIKQCDYNQNDQSELTSPLIYGNRKYF